MSSSSMGIRCHCHPLDSPRNEMQNKRMWCILCVCKFTTLDDDGTLWSLERSIIGEVKDLFLNFFRVKNR